MAPIVIALGVFLVGAVIVDLVNTLVATATHRGKWWLTSIVYRWTWRFTRVIARALPPRLGDRFMANYAPVTVLVLLGAWVVQQVVGFGLIWWGVGGLSGADGLFDSIYYSGVVYFTLGFGEVVPTDAVSRIGALIEAMSGVLTTALLIGYLPALYGAYSERERKLMMLDDGSEDRITPTNLVIARSPEGDATQLLTFFKEWEEWIAGVLETHTSFPMLRLFRSKHDGQSWITALGLVTDAALHCQMIRGMENREPYWCIRRAIRLFDELTEGVDLAAYAAEYDTAMTGVLDRYSDHPFSDMYNALDEHGLNLLPFDEAQTQVVELRRHYGPALEFLIDEYMAPRGFWGHRIGHLMGSSDHELANDER